MAELAQREADETLWEALAQGAEPMAGAMAPSVHIDAHRTKSTREKKGKATRTLKHTISGVISPLIWFISIVALLITHEEQGCLYLGQPLNGPNLLAPCISTHVLCASCKGPGNHQHSSCQLLPASTYPSKHLDAKQTATEQNSS